MAINICRDIGGGAQTTLTDANIKLFDGVSGHCNEAVEALLNGTLEYNDNVKCNHHGHHGDAHKCGDYGCGHNFH